MEHILFLTGHLAQPSLERVLAGIEAAPFTWEVRDLGLQVAGLMTADMIRRRLTLPEGFDRIIVPGKTFKYAADGAEGLAGSKRVIVAISRGGFYGADSPAAALEHLESYLRGVFGFIGIRNPEFISADGIMVGPEHREKALAGALEAATKLQAA